MIGTRRLDDALIQGDRLLEQRRDDVRPVERYSRVNIGGAANVCRAARDLKIQRQGFTSSVAGDGLPEGVADADAPRRAFHEYGRTQR